MQTYFPASPEEALTFTGEYRAGGTDVQARQNKGLRSEDIIDLSKIEGYADISFDSEGNCRIGSLRRLSYLAEDSGLLRHFPLLAEASGKLATPQIRNMATLGGALLQLTRCPYFRQIGFDCLKKGDASCSFRESGLELPICLDMGSCAYPHPSTLGMVLLTFDASLEWQDVSLLPIAELYRPESIEYGLSPQKILAAVRLNAASSAEQSSYFRLINRAESEWPEIECAVRLLMDGTTIREARIAVGGIANIPLRLPASEKVLQGQELTITVLEKAAAAAQETQYTVLDNYKWKLLPGTVLETLLRAGGLDSF